MAALSNEVIVCRALRHERSASFETSVALLLAEGTRIPLGGGVSSRTETRRARPDGGRT